MGKMAWTSITLGTVCEPQRRQQYSDPAIRSHPTAHLFFGLSARVLCECEQAERILPAWISLGTRERTALLVLPIVGSHRQGEGPMSFPKGGEEALRRALCTTQDERTRWARSRSSHRQRRVAAVGFAHARPPTNTGRLVSADRWLCMCHTCALLTRKRPGGPDSMVPVCGSLGQHGHETSSTSLSPPPPVPSLGGFAAPARWDRCGAGPLDDGYSLSIRMEALPCRFKERREDSTNHFVIPWQVVRYFSGGRTDPGIAKDGRWWD